MVYYEFNRTGNGGKYKEMSAEEYEQAKQDPNRWFLEGWDEDGKVLLYVMECSKEMYDEVQYEKNHSAYIGRDKSNRKAIVLRLEPEMECSYELSAFHNGESVSVADIVLDELGKIHDRHKIRIAMEQLKPEEQYMVMQIAVVGRRQSSLAKELGVSRASVNERYHNILLKLRKILEQN